MSPRANVQINAFNTGEVSPLIDQRSDLAKYASACHTMENSLPLVEGGAKKMPGTYFAGATALGGAMFTGSISGDVLTVSAVNYGVLQLGQTLSGAGIAAGTTLSASQQISGSVSAIGITFSAVVDYPLTPPTISIAISGDGTGASAGVGFTVSGTYPNLVFTPKQFLIGGSGYTHATATVTITNGNSVYPNGTNAYPCTIAAMGNGLTGVGGVGTYNVSIAQTVASEQMQTASSGISRLVPFQFSTIQGAILELSAGIIRIWEGASQGSWSLGLALQTPTAANYNPATAYVLGNTVLIGPYCPVYKDGNFGIGTLYITAPYGTSNANTVPVTVTTNSTDNLAVTITGASPNQGINIALANATASKNAASAIQTAVQALGSLNSSTSNYVSLAAWTVTPDSIYYANPWIVAPGYPSSALSFSWQNFNEIAVCVNSNQNDEFPIIFSSQSWNSTYWEQGTAGVQPIQLATPYAAADLFALDCSTQSADVLWIFHPNYPPAVVERLSANSWAYSLSLPGQQPGEPAYRGTTDVISTGYTGLGLSISAITQANPCVVTVAATNASFAPGSRVYINEVAGMVELNQGEFIVGSVTYGSGTCSFSLLDPDTNANVNSTGYLAYVSGGFAVQVVALFNSAGNYPACGTLYQERLCVGGSLNNPTQLNGSVEDDYPDFIADPNEDDYAFQYTLVANQLNQLLNMVGTPNALLIGTAGGVWVVSGSNGASLGPTNVNAALQTTQGVAQLQPQVVNGSGIFVSRSARIVTFLQYSFVTNQWENTDLTRLNREITIGTSAATSGIAQTAFQMEPYPIFWAVRNDGQLIGLVFNTQDQVFAWFRVNMTAEGGIIESAALITGQGQEDQLVVVVNRTINGLTQRYVEYFMPQELFHQIENSFFVHSGLQFQGVGPFNITGITNANPAVVSAPGHTLTNGMSVAIAGVQGMTQANTNPLIVWTVAGVSGNTFELQGIDSTAWGAYTSGGTCEQVTNQLSGMSYLLGQNVIAVGDLQVIFEGTVAEDTVTLGAYANAIVIGLPFTSTLQPLNPVIGNQQNTSKGKRQKFSRATISLYEAVGGEIGVDASHLYSINYEQTQGNPPTLFTGAVTNDLDGDWGDTDTIMIVHSDPFPFTVRAIEPRLSVAEEG